MAAPSDGKGQARALAGFFADAEVFEARETQMPNRTKFVLDEREMPTSWYNVQPDLPEPLAPPLGPDDQPIGPEALAPLFPMELIKQEMCQER